MPTDLARTAAALKRDHGDLLRREPWHGDTAQMREAINALEAARLRLCGDDRLASGQLALTFKAG